PPPRCSVTTAAPGATTPTYSPRCESGQRAASSTAPTPSTPGYEAGYGGGGVGAVGPPGGPTAAVAPPLFGAPVAAAGPPHGVVGVRRHGHVDNVGLLLDRVPDGLRQHRCGNRRGAPGRALVEHPYRQDGDLRRHPDETARLARQRGDHASDLGAGAKAVGV